MSFLTLRREKGVPLTNDEVDDNFEGLFNLRSLISRVVYVSQDGNDENDGLDATSAVASVARGLEVARSMSGPIEVSVSPGHYYEDGELEVPEECSVCSTGGQYVTTLYATEGNEEKNMFLVNSGSYIQGFGFRQQRVDDLDDPTGGFAVAFKPGAKIMRSPYMRDLSQVSQYVPNAISAPLDQANANPLVGNGGGVLLADRAVLDADSSFPYMLAFGATPRSPNGLGYVAKNGAGINGIGSISVFSRCSFYALNGGQITLNNSGTQFGDISMRSKGSTQVVDPAQPSVEYPANLTDSGVVSAYADAAVDTMWDNMLVEGYNTNWSEEKEAAWRSDASRLLRVIELDMEAGTYMATQRFALSKFDYKADYSFDPLDKSPLLFAYTELEDYYQPLLTEDGELQVSALFDLLRGTIDTPDKVTFTSLIESLGHQFNNAGAGVNRNALPLNFRSPGTNRSVPFTIVQEEGGRISWSGSDERNNQYLAGGTRINGRTGRIEGRPFDAAVRQIARRVANTRASFT